MYEQSKLLRSVKGIKHGFSLRSGGVSAGAYESLNLGFNTKDDTSLVQENLARFRAAAGLEHEIFELQQVHGHTVITYDGQANRTVEGDAITTITANIPIGIRTADCLPLLFVHLDSADEYRANMVAAAHAGWRGAVQGIGEQTLQRLIEMGADIDAIKVAVGPCIGFEQFEVGSEVIEAAQASLRDGQVRFITKPNGKYLLDLRSLVVSQLIAAGVKKSCIDLVGGCTFSEPEKYFSYRRDHGKSGRHLSFIALSSS